MPRIPKPWFRKDRDSWFVTISGVRHKLGRDKKEAFKQFYDLMRAPSPETVPPISGRSFAAVADKFLDWVQKNRSPHTYEWYRYRIERFCQRYPELTVSELKPYHVQEWVDSYPKLTSTTKRNYIRSMKRCLLWAKQQGLIDSNPIEALSAPGANRREVVLSLDEFNAMMANIPDPAMKLLCEVAFETGCRPQEILRVEARHVDVKFERWVLPTVEAKGKKAPRVIYQSKRTMEISLDLMKKYPTGKLFRNSEGNPWKVFAVNCAFKRLQQRMGKLSMKQQGINIEDELIKEIKLDETMEGRDMKSLTFNERRKLTNRAYGRFAPKYSLYALRHSWATRALQSGRDALTVAILMGHSDPSMLAKVYQHLAQSPEHMLNQARKVSGG